MNIKNETNKRATSNLNAKEHHTQWNIWIFGAPAPKPLQKKNLAERSHTYTHTQQLLTFTLRCPERGRADVSSIWNSPNCLYELREGARMCTYGTEEPLPIQHTRIKNLIKYKLKEVYCLVLTMECSHHDLFISK